MVRAGVSDMHAKSSGYYSGYYDEGVTESRRRIPGWLPQVLGYSLSAGCLIWVLHGYPLNELGPTLRALDYRWVGLAVAVDLAVCVVHGWRWTTLLAPVARVSFWRTVQAIYIGLFANEVLPLRSGELIRCYLLAHWNDLRVSLTFASAGVERQHLMGNPRTLGLTAAISLLYLALQILSVFALMRAYGLDLSFWVAGGVLTLVRLSTVVPNAPGNLGLINLACVMALGLFEVEQNDAKTFSIILFVALTLPLLIGGAVATALTGLNIGELHDRARQRAGRPASNQAAKL